MKMTKRFRKKMHGCIHTNKGFTLVELIVVLILMSILLSVGIFGVLGWIDWAEFNKANEAAEDIFYAAQNQLTELDSSDAMDRKVNSVLQNNGVYIDKYVLAQGTTVSGGIIKDDFSSIKNTRGKEYEWSSIWLDKNRDKEIRTLIRIVADAGEYSKYANDPSTYNGDAGTKLLFDLIASYISDKSVLDGAIALEFSPEAGQVFSVCYSDKQKSFDPEKKDKDGYLDISDRTLAVRESNMLGYYAVDTMTSKIKGRSRIADGYMFEIENGNALIMSVSSSDSLISDFSGANLKFSIQGSSLYNDDYAEIMSFSISKEKIESIKYDGIRSISEAMDHPVEVEVELGRGIYSSKTQEFRLPVWIDTLGKISIALDATDIQAQSITYADTMELLGSDTDAVNAAKTAFRNTFSFYRFGMPDVRFIRASVEITGSQTGSTEAGRKVINPDDFKKYGESDIYGEAVTFANYSDGDNDNTYGIENGRHLYNIRFESDYSDAMRAKNLIDTGFTREFILKADIDWKKDFLGGDDGTDYLFNSYMTTEASGIDLIADQSVPEFAYLDRSEDENKTVYPVADTRRFPFPGFRILSYGDIFTQSADLSVIAKGDTSAADISYYKISGLDISFAANCIYGVYGKTAQGVFIGDDAVPGTEQIKYNSLNGTGKEGSMPLGLFAENFGTISNIELDDIEVRGVEGYPVNDPASFLFTCKVGGFVGENFGTLSSLLIDVAVDKPQSYIRGRSDVGGIVGHQYYMTKASDGSDTVTVTDQEPYADAMVTLAYCVNNANVTGIGYVGGVIGRIYPSGGTAGGNQKKGKESFDTTFTKNGSKVYYSDNYIEPVSITSSEVSEYSVNEIKKYTIDTCVNHGDISMDPYFAENDIDNNTYRRGYYFGGITGAALNTYNYNYDKDNHYYKHNTAATRIAVISNCTSYTLYSEAELDDILLPGTDEDKINEAKRRMKACFVGGIVGGIRYGYIDYCSTTPDMVGASEASSGNEYSFVFGDRYVGGVAGYCMETDFLGGAEYTSTELAKITKNTSGYRDDYSIINGTSAVGNYAVGGITGSFGRPETNNKSRNPNLDNGYVEAYADVLESMYGKYVVDNNTYTGDRNFPANCGQITKTKDGKIYFEITGLLNTAVVLGGSYTSQVNLENTSNSGIYYGVGGVAGLLAAVIRNADSIQTEDMKNLNIKYIFGEKPESVQTALDELSVDDLQEKVDSSDFTTDGVGGIVGLALGTGDINVSDGTKKYNSYIDSIIFGRNRVGGGVGDTTACRGSQSRIANFYPIKATSSSSGMYVMGKDCVGGVIGAFGKSADTLADASLSRKDDYDGGWITSGYHVIGNRAVGGFIGEFCETNNNKMIYIRIGEIGGNSDKVYVKGSMYVGGLVGLQESYPTSNSISKPDEYYGYDMYLRNVEIEADCFGGCVFGALFTKNGYAPIDKLIYYSGTVNDNSRNNPINQIHMDCDICGGCITGLYAFNGSSEMLKKDTQWTNVNNYVPDGQGTEDKPYLSKNGLYKNSTIKALTYLSEDERNEEEYLKYVNRLKTIFNGKTDNRITMELFNLSEKWQAGGDNNLCHVVTNLYAGGLFGFTADTVNVTVNGYRNRARLVTKLAILSKEMGNNDNAYYSYLGAVTGKVPKGMILNYCRNTSARKENNDYNGGDYHTKGNGNNYYSPKATYVGLMVTMSMKI